MNDFIDRISAGAVEAQKKYGVLASLTIAQAILETGWGKYSVGNNIFGIKASPSWTGETVTAVTGEVIDGNPVKTTGTFRAYDNIEASIEDHAQLFVRNDCYHNLIGCTDYREACVLVQEDGYATSPTYADNLISIIEDNNLTQYDVQAQEAEPPEAPDQPAEDTYIIVRDVPSYYTAADAAANSNARGVVHPGTYSVFNRAKGCINVTSAAGQPGSWINPADNTADADPEPDPEAPAPEMRIGATVQYSGLLYADSYGGGAGMTISGTYPVDNYIPGRACAVHIPAGWVPETDCTVVA